MTLYNVYLLGEFYDAAERTRTISYLMRTQYDSTANTGAGNWVDVLSDAADAITALNVLTWDSIPNYHVSMTHLGGGSPAIQANNQIAAFTRIYDVGGDAGSILVPAWDDTIYDEDNRNIIDPAYNTAVAALALLLRNPATLEDFVLVPQFSQSRTRKSRDIVS